MESLDSMPLLEGGRVPWATVQAWEGRFPSLPPSLSSAEAMPHQPLFKG